MVYNLAELYLNFDLDLLFLFKGQFRKKHFIVQELHRLSSEYTLTEGLQTLNKED